jgi:hypothetical protein
VPGKQGFLEAFDGTNDGKKKGTEILKFYEDYAVPQDMKRYHRGVGNTDEFPKITKERAEVFALGDKEALREEEIAVTQVTAFYNSDPKHLPIPLDTVGYSRGSMEAVKLVNDLATTGIMIASPEKQTTRGQVNVKAVHPTVRYVGLISPVMGPLEVPGIWPTSLPAGVGWLYQALDGFPNSQFLPEHTITRAPGTSGYDFRYRYKHTDIGYQEIVRIGLRGEGKDAGAPIDQ